MIDAKWVYTWKVDEHGWVVKAKSRLVARGFKQREGVDFGETFAPTVSSSCVRLLSAIACECDLDFCHFDVDQAFVQSDLEEDVFLRLPKGCGDLSGKVVRLNKSLYGLNQDIGYNSLRGHSLLPADHSGLTAMRGPTSSPLFTTNQVQCWREHTSSPLSTTLSTCLLVTQNLASYSVKSLPPG